jgi:hypothetical protein
MLYVILLFLAAVKIFRVIWRHMVIYAYGRVIPRQEFRYVKMSFKEVYDCEVLITEI